MQIPYRLRTQQAYARLFAPSIPSLSPQGEFVERSVEHIELYLFELT